MLKQPVMNIKLTNVATIRYKINNRNFQIACYRNKALNWRNGVEEDLSEVLQTQEIYENASHGTVAKKADLNKFFPNKTKKEIIEIILARGELQISDKERDLQQTNMTGDIIKVIVEKCVHPTTKRRFTFENIRQALKDIHFAVKTDQPAKKQALECIKLLQKRYKISRGEMRVKITSEKAKEETMSKKLKELGITDPISTDQKGTMLSKVYDIEPNKYRELTQLCKEEDNATVEVLINVVTNTQHKDLESQQSGALQLLDEFKDKVEQTLTEQQKQDKRNETKNLSKQMSDKLNIHTKKEEEKAIRCTTCGDHAIFGTTHEHRQHFKTEWHVENIKRKSKGLTILSEEEYRIEVFNKNYQ